MITDPSKRPVSWEEDGYTVTRSTAWGAPGCHEGCGILLYSKDGKLVKVEGDPLHPYNQGSLCPRCIALPETVNHEDRLMYPMKRDPKFRGQADKWERISWEEAYDLCESEFKRIIAEYGPESITVFNGTGRDTPMHSFMLGYAMGTPNIPCALSGISCYIPRLVAGLGVYGAVYPVADCSQQFEDRYDNPEWRLPETLVLWGINPTDSNPDWFYGAWIVECMKRGSKLIVADPRLTWLASRAEYWLGLRPGTDAALAMGFLNVIIQEDLYDHDFVDRWTYGFEALKEAVAPYTPEKTAEITWVDAETIVEAARFYAKSKPAAMQLGLAVDQQKSGFPAAQTLMAIQCITGCLDVPGGNIFCVEPFGVNTGGQNSAGLGLTEEAKSKAIGIKEYPVMMETLAMPSPDICVQQLETDEPYPLRGCWLMQTNLLTCTTQDPLRWQKAFQAYEFVVCPDVFMNPTMQCLADLVLPVATTAEKSSVRAQFYNLSTTNPAITPPGECKTDQEVMYELGRRFNPEIFPGEGEIDVIDKVLEPSGMSYNELKDNKGWAYPHFEYKRYEKGLMRPDGKPGFNTPTGRVEFDSLFCKHFNLPTTPYFEEPTLSPVTTPEIYAEYPLIMITGARQKTFFHSEHRWCKSLREITPDPFVDINPEYAAEHGIKDGDWVWIETPKDRIRQKARITRTLQKGMALSYHAWWYPEIKDPDRCYGMWEVNNNRLIDMGNVGPSGFGADIKCVLAKIYKADKSPLDDPEIGILERKEENDG